MGLEGGKSDKTYVSIVGCKFVIRVPAGTDGAVARKLTKGKNEGKEVHELHYSRLRGRIVYICHEQKDFGEYLTIDIKDEVKTFTLNIPWDNFSVRDNFIKQLPNMSEKEYVCLNVFEGDDERVVFLVRQGIDAEGNEKIVPFSFTKDNPQGIPQPTETTVRGVAKWNWDAVVEFLYKVLIKESGRFKNTVYDDGEMSLETVMPEDNGDCIDEEPRKDALATEPTQQKQQAQFGDDLAPPPF